MRLGAADIEEVTRDDGVIVEVMEMKSHYVLACYAERLDRHGNNTQYHTQVNMLIKPSRHVLPILIMQMYPPTTIRVSRESVCRIVGRGCCRCRNSINVIKTWSHALTAENAGVQTVAAGICRTMSSSFVTLRRS